MSDSGSDFLMDLLWSIKEDPRSSVSDDRPPRFAVIGSGRSGTTYVTGILRANGVHCGHESWFTCIPGRIGGLDGDASWLGLPDIESGHWSGPVVHIVRNPVDVVRSLIGIQFFEDYTDESSFQKPYQEFAYRHCPKISGLHGVDAAVEWWVDWNGRCSAVADVQVRIEDLMSEHVLSQIGDVLDVHLDVQAARTVPTAVNTRTRASIESSRVWEALDGRADKYGYQETR